MYIWIQDMYLRMHCLILLFIETDHHKRMNSSPYSNQRDKESEGGDLDLHNSRFGYIVTLISLTIM